MLFQKWKTLARESVMENSSSTARRRYDPGDSLVLYLLGRERTVTGVHRKRPGHMIVDPPALKCQEGSRDPSGFIERQHPYVRTYLYKPRVCFL